MPYLNCENPIDERVDDSIWLCHKYEQNQKVYIELQRYIISREENYYYKNKMEGFLWLRN